MAARLRVPVAPRRRRWSACALAVGFLATACQAAPAPSDTDARIRFYERRLDGPGAYPSYARLGLAYLRKARETGDVAFYARAEHVLSQSLELQRNYEAILGLSSVHLAMHRFDQALQYAREAVETLPSDPDAHATLVDALLSLGRLDEAVVAAEKLAAMSQGFQALTRMALLRAARGETAAAIELMTRAKQTSEREALPAESRAWCHVQLAALHTSNCDPDAAERELHQALEHVPGYPAARERLAALRASTDRTAEASASRCRVAK